MSENENNSIVLHDKHGSFILSWPAHKTIEQVAHELRVSAAAVLHNAKIKHPSKLLLDTHSGLPAQQITPDTVSQQPEE